MAVKKPQNNKNQKGKKPVQKTIAKKDQKQSGVVDESFEVNEMERYTGKCVYFNRSSGYGFVKLDESSVVPEDKVMVYWKELKSDDRWPFLHKDLEVEFNLAKVKKGRNFTVIAKEVTAAGGATLNLQEEQDSKKEYVGDQNMRFLGNVKFYDFQKGFGYVKIQDGYDIDAEVPKEFQCSRTEINAGTDAPRLSEGMEVEFGIAKNNKGKYTCYNVTLPGGADITRNLVEGRELVGNQKFNGEVNMWAWKNGFGWVKPTDMTKFPKKIKDALKEDHEKRLAKAKKNGKDIPKEPMLYIRTADKASPETRLNKGDKVTFKLYTDKMGVGACEVALA